MGDELLIDDRVRRQGVLFDPGDDLLDAKPFVDAVQLGYFDQNRLELLFCDHFGQLLQDLLGL